MELVGHGGSEGVVGVEDERGGEVVVGGGVVDGDVAEAAGDNVEPALLDGVGKEGRYVGGDEGGVGGEFGDLLGD